MRHLLVFLIAMPILALGQSESRVYDNLTMTSDILSMDRKYAVYLPPDYHTSSRSYPVLYLLHGGGDDQTGWVQFGEVKHITDKAIQEGRATSMIIVMPDAQTGQRGYFNDPKNEWRYEDFFFEEFMPHVESEYRVKREKRYRAVAGLSMGGGGSFIYALHRPELFSSVCPLSASTGPLTLEDTKRWFERIRPNASYTDSELSAYYEKYSTLAQIQSIDAETLNSLRWFIDCGDDDFLYEGNSLVHIALRKKEVRHEFRIRNGGHTWTYWRESLPEVLAFISDAFHQY